MLSRRALLAGAVVGTALPLTAKAQAPPKRWRVGYLSAGFAHPGGLGGWEAFRNALRDSGYVEGQNLILDTRLP